jgi:hypothetical protein
MIVEDDDVAVSNLLEELPQHRRGEADQVKRILLMKHSVRVYYRHDGTIGWSKVDRDAEDTEAATRGIIWSMITTVLLGRASPEVVFQGRTARHRDGKCRAIQVPPRGDDGSSIVPRLVPRRWHALRARRDLSICSTYRTIPRSVPIEYAPAVCVPVLYLIIPTVK